jgi:hypothetical protein
MKINWEKINDLFMKIWIFILPLLSILLVAYSYFFLIISWFDENKVFALFWVIAITIILFAINPKQYWRLVPWFISGSGLLILCSGTYFYFQDYDKYGFLYLLLASIWWLWLFLAFYLFYWSQKNRNILSLLSTTAFLPIVLGFFGLLHFTSFWYMIFDYKSDSPVKTVCYKDEICVNMSYIVTNNFFWENHYLFTKNTRISLFEKRLFEYWYNHESENNLKIEKEKWKYFLTFEDGGHNIFKEEIR